MRSSDEWIVYAGVVLAFGAVVLWATEADALVVLAFAAVAAMLLAAGAWRSRRAARVLVVGPRRTEAIDLMDETLDGAGYVVRSCDGPHVRPCPLDAGLPCRIHGRVAAAVIVRAPDDDMPIPRCGEALHVPATTVEPTMGAISTFRSSLRFRARTA
jgi:hypothetical protein